MNPADVLALPMGLLEEMARVIAAEDRAQRRANMRARRK